MFREIDEYIEKLKFEHIRGPERGKINKEVRELLEKKFENIVGINVDLFKKRIDRIIWELVTLKDFYSVKEVLSDIVNENLI